MTSVPRQSAGPTIIVMIQHIHHLRRRSVVLSALLLPVIGTLLALGAVTSVSAGDTGEKAARKAAEMTALRDAVTRKEIQPLPRIMSIAQSKVPGDVVKTELETKDGRWIYEIKILTPTGRVREVKLDARSGAIFAIEDD